MISLEALDELRRCVSSRLSADRYMHTLGVERCACFLADMCLKEKSTELSCAALLHDITKELSLDEHLEILKFFHHPISEYDIGSAAVLHSFTAPYVILRDYPNFATEEIISAVGKHTLGDGKMTVFDRIIFLADFIEDTRKYASSKAVREYVLSSMREGMISENTEVLRRACLMEIEATISHLTDIKRPVHPKTLEAKAGLIAKI